MTSNADSSDTIALNWIGRNPGKHGDEMPREIAHRLKALETRGLVRYSSRSGWRLTGGAPCRRGTP